MQHQIDVDVFARSDLLTDREVGEFADVQRRTSVPADGAVVTQIAADGSRIGWTVVGWTDALSDAAQFRVNAIDEEPVRIEVPSSVCA
ncbi:MAG TPA: hypothetical protein VLA82_07615 [Actinomycetota bacterium]|nr:hypothetical protein [Actinomycetota bacterium]